jgi:hypothetical protein
VTVIKYYVSSGGGSPNCTSDTPTDLGNVVGAVAHPLILLDALWLVLLRRRAQQGENGSSQKFTLLWGVYIFVLLGIIAAEFLLRLLSPDEQGVRTLLEVAAYLQFFGLFAGPGIANTATAQRTDSGTDEQE